MIGRCVRPALTHRTTGKRFICPRVSTMANSRGRRKLRRQLTRGGQLPKRSSPQKSHSRTQAPTIQPIWKRIPKWIYAIFGVLALIGSLLALYPWLSIQKDDSFSATDPYGTAFSVANDGYIPIVDLEAVCYPDYGDDARTWGVFSNYMPYPHFAKMLAHSDRATLPCFRIAKIFSAPEMLNASSRVNLTIFVNYAFMGFNAKALRRHQEFRFRAVRAEDNSLHWIFLH